jgi:hypothetical protein
MPDHPAAGASTTEPTSGLNADVAQNHERPSAPSAGPDQGTPRVDAGSDEWPAVCIELAAAGVSS